MATYAKERKMANAIRFLAAEMIEKAKSGHPGMPLGIADVATMLFSKFIKVNPQNPKWFDRDRFVLSAGHASSLLYSLFYLLGYKDITLDDLQNFRQLGAKTAGHPEYGHMLGIDMTTGPLGEGISSAVGMALAEKLTSDMFGSEVCDHKTYVIMGDGCLMEGVAMEAIALAGHWQLNKLIAIWDDNQVTIDGRTDIASSTDMKALFAAHQWNVISIDGHDFAQIEKALAAAQTSERPTLIAARTKIGYGAPDKCDTPKCHGSPLGAEELTGMRQNLDWPFAPFEVPEDVLADWRQAGERNEALDKEWQKRAQAKGRTFADFVAGKLPQNWDNKLNELKERALQEKPEVATRKASNMCLEAIVPQLPQLIGGSADLSSPNMTKTTASAPIKRQNLSGNYIEYGIREHAMAAIMNGLALHGGFVPYGGTFLVFSDFMRPAMRLAALMGLREIYVLTHDSIGVGEDGPTHQPIEHLASLRAMPNMLTFRPCDVIETAEAWQLAIAQEKRPSVLALSRQNLPLLRENTRENLTAKGAYIIRGKAEGRQATLIATGSEVALAVAAYEELKTKGIATAVVSMPCQELFDEQPFAYQDAVLGSAPRIAVEAASKFGWEKYVGLNGDIIGMDGFGASAPAKDLYAHFGITKDEIVEAVEDALKK
ncbi:MAG: transketolase [Alphaproteobacteria bacterium]|nr:transketolase [Alphaproteobacteria bacterium]